MKLRISTLLGFILTVSASTMATEVTLDTGSGELKGTLIQPESGNNNTVALIISGSGPTDRDGNNPAMVNNSLKMLVEELEKVGVSSLRYDKRGVAKSADAGVEESELRFDTYINDASHWVDYLHEQRRFEKIVVIGHSEGSLIGMVVSQEETVDQFVSIAGPGRPIDQTIREQLQAQPPIVLEHSEPILDKLLQGETVAEVPEFLHSLFRPSVQPYMISWFKFDPRVEVAKLNKPVLIVQGETDIQVSVSDAEYLAEANKKADKVLIAGMNHVLKEAPLDSDTNIQTYNQPELPIKPELVKVIADFILKN